MKADDLNANRFVLDFKTTSDVRAKLKNDPQGGLKAAAQQFESLMLQMMLKSMREATSQDGMMDSDQTRFYTSILDQQLAQTLASKGTLGFAKLVEQQLGRSTAAGTNAETVAGAVAGTNLSPETLQQLLLQRQAAISASQHVGAGAQRVRNTLAVESGQSDPSVDGTKNQDFVNRVWPHAVEAAATLGVPPQFLVAHAALESGWGKSEIRSGSGQASYNLFGVKAGKSWPGNSVEVQTTEYVNGEAQSVREKFRVYGSYAEAFRDYASLLKNNARFSAVLGQQDGTQFARTLQQGGYATDPAYADKLGRIINGTTLRQALVG